MKALHKIREQVVYPNQLVRYIKSNFKDLDYDKRFEFYKNYVDSIETVYNNNEWFEIAIKLGMVRGDGEPVRCHYCGGSDFKKAPYYENGVLCDMEIKCNECKECTGHWMHGFWQV